MRASSFITDSYWMQMKGSYPRPCRSKKKRIRKKWAKKARLAGTPKFKKDRDAVWQALASGIMGTWQDITIYIDGEEVK